MDHIENEDNAIPLSPAEEAEVTPVPEPYRQRVRGPRYKLWVNLIDLFPAVLFFGGAGVGGWGVWQSIKNPSAPAAIAVVVGVLCSAWGAYTAVLCVCVYSNRWIERCLRSEIGERPDAIVDPRDPDSIYVSIISRKHFTELHWTFASDILLLKVDHARRELLMEGDSDRYRIPAGAIARCQRKRFSFPIDPNLEIWMVRLVVYFPDETKEILIGYSHATFKPTTNARRFRVADELCRQIRGIFRGRDFDDD